MGAVERTNQTIFKKIRKLSKFGENDWKRIVEKATYAYNISFNRSIDCSPIQIKYGIIPDLLIDQSVGRINKKISIEYLRAKRDKKFYNYAKNNIEKGKILNKETYEIGDKVLVYKEMMGNKLAAKWLPGYEIKERILEDSYIVTKMGKKYRINKDYLKKENFSDGEVSLP